MSFARILTMMIRDLGRGPRSPVFLYATLMPLLITFVTQVVLLALFLPTPKMGIADLDGSSVTAGFEGAEGVDVIRAGSAERLEQLVAGTDVDAGLVLPVGFDEAVAAGERPPLQLLFAGESRITHRIILAVHALDLVRAIEGRPCPAEVTLTAVGDGPKLPLKDLIVLGVVLWPLLVCGIFVPGFMLVQEKEQGTLQALLVTPTTMAEVLTAKGAFAFLLVLVMCLLTLALNGAIGAEPLALVLCLALAALMCNQIGLIYGAIARDGKVLYNLVQTLNMVAMGPLLFYFFPKWPQWPAMLFPTYWFIDPLYKVALRGVPLAEVAWELGIGLAVVGLLMVPVVALGRRMEAKLVAG